MIRAAAALPSAEHAPIDVRADEEVHELRVNSKAHTGETENADEDEPQGRRLCPQPQLTICGRCRRRVKSAHRALFSFSDCPKVPLPDSTHRLQSDRLMTPPW